MNKKTVLSILNITGTVASVLLIGYVLLNSFEAIQNSTTKFDSWVFWGSFLVSLGSIFVATLLLPVAYSYILSQLHKEFKATDHKIVWPIYGVTQLLKYLPGNVFHFVGRQLQLSKLSISHAVIGNTSLIEMMSQAIVAGAISIVIAKARFASILESLNLNSNQLAILGFGALGATAAAAWIVYFLKSKNISIGLKFIAGVFFIHGCYFIISSIGFWLILKSLDFDSVHLNDAVLIFSIAWLLGAIMPGASAGIGVREAVILALGLYLLGDDLSLAAILLRVNTVLGDLGLWMISSQFYRVVKEPAT